MFFCSRRGIPVPEPNKGQKILPHLLWSLTRRMEDRKGPPEPNRGRKSRLWSLTGRIRILRGHTGPPEPSRGPRSRLWSLTKRMSDRKGPLEPSRGRWTCPMPGKNGRILGSRGQLQCFPELGTVEQSCTCRSGFTVLLSPRSRYRYARFGKWQRIHNSVPVHKKIS